MAGSRVHKFGSIFKRMNGMMRAGAIRYEDRPLWYDVYEAFPPNIEPRFERPEPDQQVVNILYPEDYIRAKFYRDFGCPDPVDLKDEGSQTLCQRFIDKYLELQSKGVDRAMLFDTTTQEMNASGAKLRRREELYALLPQKEEAPVERGEKENLAEIWNPRREIQHDDIPD